MSPRRHGRSRRSGGPQQGGRGADPGAVWGEERESGADGDWRLRRVSGASAAKPYRCPGCDQLIPPGVPHIVVWPDDGAGGGVEDRRHWHTVCWEARHRRRPRRRF